MSFTIGQLVRVTPPGRRAFEAPILAVRSAEMAVDVKDPKTGGLRTVAARHVETVRPLCEACGAEIPKGRRRCADGAGRLVCSGCFHGAGDEL
jgi:hypothetical protein